MAERRRNGGRIWWIGLFGMAVLLLVSGAVIMVPGVRSQVRALVRPEPPPRITPLALEVPASAPATATPPPATAVPTNTRTAVPTATTAASRAASAEATVEATAPPAPTATAVPTPEPTATPAVVERGGRVYDAYIPAATKEGQFYQYSCEFDAAWVVLETYGISVGADELIDAIAHDTAVEPYIEETAQGFLIHGGDITTKYSGDYTKNFLARSTAPAFAQVFERYGLATTLVSDRAGVERALKRGQLVWMKTTVDFNRWRPATWVMPDGRTYQTVLGNDHAVVAIGFSARGVVIRDVLGPTSTNRSRPYEYEVDWETFMAAWGAQSYDALAVARPAS